MFDKVSNTGLIGQKVAIQATLERSLWLFREEEQCPLSMEDRDGFIWLDGKLVPWLKAACMCPPCAALRLGVFEGERIYDGRVFRLAATAHG